MLRVEHDGEKWVFLASVADGGWQPKARIAFRRGGTEGYVFVTTHEIELVNDVHVMCVEVLRDPVTGVRYELTPIEEEQA